MITYTLKLSKSQADELRKEASLFGFDNIEEYYLRKMKFLKQLEEDKSLRYLIEKNIALLK